LGGTDHDRESLMTSPSDAAATIDRERADLIETLAAHRHFLRFTAEGLTDAQAAERTTVSALTLAGLLKHVADTEAQWISFIERGPDAFGAPNESWGDAGEGESGGDAEAWEDPRFVVPEGTTLDELLAAYAQVAERTEAVIRSLPSLDAEHPLPVAPWFEPGARWSARRVLIHVLAETSQHAGHADIIRESLDGQKTMG
jgi:uncharacterized damage-inducible protein DinB